MKFAMSYDLVGRTVLTAFGCGPRRTEVTVDLIEVTVRMGYAFWAVIPRSDITSVAPRDRRVVSKGAHGWSGRWLVNGSSAGLVTVTIDPAARGRVFGVRIRLRELTLSLDDADGFMTAIAPPQ